MNENKLHQLSWKHTHSLGYSQYWHLERKKNIQTKKKNAAGLLLLLQNVECVAAIQKDPMAEKRRQLHSDVCRCACCLHFRLPLSLLNPDKSWFEAWLTFFCTHKSTLLFWTPHLEFTTQWSSVLFKNSGIQSFVLPTKSRGKTQHVSSQTFSLFPTISRVRNQSQLTI